MRTLAHILLPLGLAGCQAAPPPATLAPGDTGLVIGTLTLDAAFVAGLPRGDGPALLELERVAPAGAVGQHYQIGMQLEAGAPRASFAAALPAGAYQVRTARLPGIALEPATLAMPFEVTAARVVDIGQRPYRSRPD